VVQAAMYLATAPKSNALYQAYGLVRKEIEKTGSLPVPLHLRNAPTSLMKGLGYGRDYRYAHDYPDTLVAQEYLPERLKGRHYYYPSERGYEKNVKTRLEIWRRKLGLRPISIGLGASQNSQDTGK
jgi:putative ATPase